MNKPPGVANSPGSAKAVCILDADVLTDRDFVVRNADRFRQPGTGGHVPYRDILCLSPAAASQAIGERLYAGRAEPDFDSLSGFTLRHPMGCCMWVQDGALHRAGGIHERYEGWGGEDNDLAYRLDRLLHLYHSPSSELRDNGELVNAHIPPLNWRPGQAIGLLDRFSLTEPALAAGGS